MFLAVVLLQIPSTSQRMPRSFKIRRMCLQRARVSSHCTLCLSFSSIMRVSSCSVADCTGASQSSHGEADEEMHDTSETQEGQRTCTSSCPVSQVTKCANCVTLICVHIFRRVRCCFCPPKQSDHAESELKCTCEQSEQSAAVADSMCSSCFPFQVRTTADMASISRQKARSACQRGPRRRNKKRTRQRDNARKEPMTRCLRPSSAKCAHTCARARSLAHLKALFCTSIKALLHFKRIMIIECERSRQHLKGPRAGAAD
jgi:hypothetical protein